MTGFRILTDDFPCEFLREHLEDRVYISAPAASFALNRSVSLINSAMVAQPVIVGLVRPISSDSTSISASVLLNPCFER